ncbi:MAG: 2-aminoethylphosphonate--pyruvate transaminase [Alphaproteobacteria bacterium]|nr:2-aminoethylphosphonate--pyruvate transaminase [Alphaproteobacteria bacterium]
MTAARPKDIFLLTPGPLTTSKETRAAMARDWGSRDSDFRDLTGRVRSKLVALLHGQGSHVAVPLQGSGTFAVEAMIGTFVPRNGKLLVLVNGAYGQRIAKICQMIGRAHAVIETPEDVAPTPQQVDAMLAKDPAITHVAIIHCETTSGIVNPVAEIGAVVEKHGKSYLIDSMSAFGALDIDARRVRFDALAASSNKCIEGVPGIGFVICRTAALEKTAGNAHALVLDLHDQRNYMEKSGQQWRFTPPTHVLAAFDAALDQHAAEGGVKGRHARYAANCKILVDGMRALGFETLLPDHLQAPIIITFHQPADPRFHFETFYDALAARGYVIYPGKLTKADSFRIGCIGQIHAAQMHGALDAVKTCLKEMGVNQTGPANKAA